MGLDRAYRSNAGTWVLVGLIGVHPQAVSWDLGAM